MSHSKKFQLKTGHALDYWHGSIAVFYDGMRRLE
jgi:hypothetical protein